MSEGIQVPTYKAYTALIGLGAALVVGYGIYKILSGPQKPIEKEIKEDDDQHKINLGSQKKHQKVIRVLPQPQYVPQPQPQPSQPTKPTQPTQLTQPTQPTQQKTIQKKEQPKEEQVPHIPRVQVGTGQIVDREAAEQEARQLQELMKVKVIVEDEQKERIEKQARQKLIQQAKKEGNLEQVKEELKAKDENYERRQEIAEQREKERQELAEQIKRKEEEKERERKAAEQKRLAQLEDERIQRLKEEGEQASKEAAEKNKQ